MMTQSPETSPHGYSQLWPLGVVSGLNFHFQKCGENWTGTERDIILFLRQRQMSEIKEYVSWIKYSLVSEELSDGCQRSADGQI